MNLPHIATEDRRQKRNINQLSGEDVRYGKEVGERGHIQPLPDVNVHGDKTINLLAMYRLATYNNGDFPDLLPVVQVMRDTAINPSAMHVH